MFVKFLYLKQSCKFFPDIDFTKHATVGTDTGQGDDDDDHGAEDDDDDHGAEDDDDDHGAEGNIANIANIKHLICEAQFKYSLRPNKYSHKNLVDICNE